MHGQTSHHVPYTSKQETFWEHFKAYLIAMARHATTSHHIISGFYDDDDPPHPVYCTCSGLSSSPFNLRLKPQQSSTTSQEYRIQIAGSAYVTIETRVTGIKKIDPGGGHA